MIVKPIEMKKNNMEQMIKFMEKNAETQIVSLKLAFTEKNVEHAVKETLRAIKQGRNISRKTNIELVLRLAGERQIQKALKKVGLEEKNLVFICFNDQPEETWERFKGNFEVKETEFPERKTEEVRRRMEKTATFWLE